MVRIVLRALGTTLLTLVVLGFVVLSRTDPGSAGVSERESTVVVLGDLPAPLPGLGAGTEGSASSGGLTAVMGAIRGYLGGEAAPNSAPGELATTPEEPEGVRVNLGRPAGAGGVRVNRGLP